MNFMEAVQAMKEGKKVKRKGIAWEASIINDVITPMSYEETPRKLPLVTRDFEATDWEVVDEDEEWNLAEGPYEYVAEDRVLPLTYIKKCRDLILKDVDDVLSKHPVHIDELTDIINKRFGDL